MFHFETHQRSRPDLSALLSMCYRPSFIQAINICYRFAGYSFWNPFRLFFTVKLPSGRAVNWM